MITSNVKFGAGMFVRVFLAIERLGLGDIVSGCSRAPALSAERLATMWGPSATYWFACGKSVVTLVLLWGELGKIAEPIEAYELRSAAG